MRVSVIVPAYHAASTLARCLAALDTQDFPRDEFEIIVVDDGSTDNTAEIAARFSSVRLIRAEHRGAAAARNAGARAARGDLVLFTDADCEPTREWIATLCRAFADARVVGAKGAYRTRQRGWIARFVQLEYEEKYARMRRARRIDFIDTYSAAYRRDVFLANGGFDESFPTASVEDQEFSFRLAEQGLAMVFVPDAIVYHRHAATLGAYARRKFRIGYWKVRVHRQHPGKLLRDTHTPPTLKMQMELFLAMVAAAIAALFAPAAWFAVSALIVIFFISAVPLLVFIVRRDAPIALIAPLLILLRAAALGAGWVAGTPMWFRK
jgi:cellulose synthase/poly-beta-1,6-N-acetylglucosamine synthase-like glycosyltransferase